MPLIYLVPPLEVARFHWQYRRLRCTSYLEVWLIGLMESAPEWTCHLPFLVQIIPFHFGSSWLELGTFGFSRTQFWAQQGHFESISGLSEKRLNLRKCLIRARIRDIDALWCKNLNLMIHYFKAHTLKFGFAL
jgi:hypothetical protein